MEQNTKQIRELTKEIRIGNRVIGGSYPILIQSMTNTKTQDVDATVEQILRLEDAGCEIVQCLIWRRQRQLVRLKSVFIFR